MYLVNTGKFAWTASDSPDVSSYRIYYSPDEQVFANWNDESYSTVPFAEVPAIEGTIEYETEISSLGISLDGTYFFVSASVDSTGNISDITPVVAVTFDATAPNPPTNFRYLPA